MSLIISLLSIAIGMQLGMHLFRCGIAMFRQRWWVCFDMQARKAWIERTFWIMPPPVVLTGRAGTLGAFDNAERANKHCDKLAASMPKRKPIPRASAA